MSTRQPDSLNGPSGTLNPTPERVPSEPLVVEAGERDVLREHLDAAVDIAERVAAGDAEYADHETLVAHLHVIQEDWQLAPSASPDLASLVASLTQERDAAKEVNRVDAFHLNRLTAERDSLTQERDDRADDARRWMNHSAFQDERATNAERLRDVYRQALEQIAEVSERRAYGTREGENARSALAAVVASDDFAVGNRVVHREDGPGVITNSPGNPFNGWTVLFDRGNYRGVSARDLKHEPGS